MLTTPVALVSMGFYFHLTLAWSTVTCECAPEYRFDQEVLIYAKMILPIFMSIYFQNKTLVN